MTACLLGHIVEMPSAIVFSPSPVLPLNVLSSRGYSRMKDNELGQRLNFCLSVRGWMGRLYSRGVAITDTAPPPGFSFGDWNEAKLVF